MSTAEFAARFRKFMEQALTIDPGEDPYFVARLREHLGADPASLPIVSEMFEPADHPNVQIALDASCVAGTGPSNAWGQAAPTNSTGAWAWVS